MAVAPRERKADRTFAVPHWAVGVVCMGEVANGQWRAVSGSGDYGWQRCDLCRPHARRDLAKLRRHIGVVVQERDLRARRLQDPSAHTYRGSKSQRTYW